MLKVLFKILIGIITLIVIGISTLIYLDSLWHPLENESFKNDILNNEITDLSIDERIDFIGINYHGEYFDYFEYTITDPDLDQKIESQLINKLPKFGNEYFRINDSKTTVIKRTWSKTPIADFEKETINYLLDTGNYHDHQASSEFIKSNFLYKPGYYYSYFAGHTKGTQLYVIDPFEKKLYITRCKI